MGSPCVVPIQASSSLKEKAPTQEMKLHRTTVIVAVLLLGVIGLTVNGSEAAVRRKKWKLKEVLAQPTPEGPFIEVLDIKILNEIALTLPTKLPKPDLAPCVEGSFAGGRLMFWFTFANGKIYQFTTCKVPPGLTPAVSRISKFIREGR
jgi:hypothetical protein